MQDIILSTLQTIIIATLQIRAVRLREIIFSRAQVNKSRGLVPITCSCFAGLRIEPGPHTCYASAQHHQAPSACSQPSGKLPSLEDDEMEMRW